MHESLTVIGIILIGMALRSCRKRIWRRLGALTYLATSGLIAYFLTDSYLWAGAIMLAWFFLPWIELASRVRKMRLPLNNQLKQSHLPHLENFPEATHTIRELDQLGFEHTSDYQWKWGNSAQHYSFYWHPEERSTVAVCLCEQSNIVFSYITITSRDCQGKLYRTSNYPFSPTLKNAPKVAWNRIACRLCSIKNSLENHHKFIEKSGHKKDQLRIPDPDLVNTEVENDMREQIDHNLEKGLITLSGDGHFRYSFRGLCFLWRQFIKDMIRLS